MEGAAGKRETLLLTSILVLAGINFFAGLGKSSLYVDEALSWSIASSGLHALIDQVKHIEITPPTYYVALHEWIGRGGSDSEVFMRLPSALAGLGLVASVVWVGARAAGRAAGLVAGGVAAISPLVLEYSQQVRAYVFAMLLTTVAIGAYLELDRRPARRTAWLAACVASSIGAVWCHYTAALVLAPVLVAGVARSTFRGREAVLTCGLVGVGWLALLPFVTTQLGQGNEQGVAHIAHLTIDNLVQAAGTPFDGRAGGDGLTPATAVGAASLVAAAVVVARKPGRSRVLLPAGFAPIGALLLVTVSGTSALVTRYLAVAAPVLIVILAAAVVRAPRPVGAAIGLAAVASGLAGSVAAHSRQGQYSDYRAEAEQIAAGARSGDVALVPGSPVRMHPVRYYFAREGVRMEICASPACRPARLSPRVWLLQEPPASRSALAQGFALIGYRLERAWTFTPGTDQQLALAVRRR